MSESTENHTLRLLQEMRKEMRESFEDIGVRINGVTQIMTLIAGHQYNLEERLSALEEKQEK